MPRWLSRTGRRNEGEAARRPPAPRLEQVESQLLQGIRQGRRSDFESLYRIYAPRLQRFLLQLMRHGDPIEEVLNDTMMVVWQHADAFDGRSKLSTWIFGIAYRKAMKAVGRLEPAAAADEADDPVDPAPGPEQQLTLVQLRARLQRALRDLSLDHRAVVELCYFQEMAYAEIAQVVGCAPETVKTRMFYARRRLRLLLGDLAGHADGDAS